MKNKLYKTFKEIDDPHLRFTIEGLAKLYYEGDVEAALTEYNSIDQIIGVKFIENQTKDNMRVQRQIPKHQ